jgi:NAD(P)-dependent dehydrogenase (short-subunit alcohol dehydrogenase family)
MKNIEINSWYDFSEKVVVVTGGAGVLLSPTMEVLCHSGARITFLGIDQLQSEGLIKKIESVGLNADFILADVTTRPQLESASDQILGKFGRVDILINGAGGNHPDATTSISHTFFDLPPTAVRHVLDLNFMGAFYCCQVFGRIMANQKEGNILNIASMNAIRPLTRIPAYSAAKSALANFTQWLAVHMAQEYSPKIRVNAIAPGFLLTHQNRFLLTEEKTGELTQRGKNIISHTPMNRFGDPLDMIGTILWLLSNASEFVSGIVIPIDGGFSAYSGI